MASDNFVGNRAKGWLKILVAQVTCIIFLKIELCQYLDDKNKKILYIL